TAGLKALGLVIVIGLLGCHKQEQQPQGPPDPTVKGETVIFADNAPQKESIVVQPADSRTLAITHLSGRLYWSDDSTVRVFPGRRTCDADSGRSRPARFHRHTA